MVADYFGNCVYISGTVSGGRFTAAGISCPADAPDGAYTMMLRPDCLELDGDGDYPLTVEVISFRGTDTLVCLRATDGTLWKKAFTSSVSWVPGDIVGARLKLHNPVLFPAFP